MSAVVEQDMQATPLVGTAGETVLAAKGATRRFGGLVAVNAVSFEVKRGEIFGLIGPNGAGKTTLFNLFTGMQTVSEGSLVHENTEIANLKPYEIAERGIARTFQNIRLFSGLSALENVKTASHLHTSSGVFSATIAHKIRTAQRLPSTGCRLRRCTAASFR